MGTSFTASDIQKAKLEKLMQNIDKPIEIPQRPKETKFVEPPDFIRNIMGSSAGAGSGEFHVYRHLRRKEYARQRFIEEQAKKEEADRRFKEMVEQKKRKVEEQTAKKRVKRLKKKERMKRAKMAKKLNQGQGKESPEEDTEEDTDEEGDEKSDSKSTSLLENDNKSGGEEMKTDKMNEAIGRDDGGGDANIGSKSNENDSSEEEIIGPLPQSKDNFVGASSIEKDKDSSKSDKQINDESAPTIQVQHEESVDKSESDDEVIGPMPVNDSQKSEKKNDEADDSDSDDEIIGPMPG